MTPRRAARVMAYMNTRSCVVHSTLAAGSRLRSDRAIHIVSPSESVSNDMSKAFRRGLLGSALAIQAAWQRA
jgi:hypothetical protein